jgi:deoxyhypusine synthase
MSIKNFVSHNYRHFNARALGDAAQGYVDFLDSGGKMFVTLAGAMSTAEIGLSLAEMIRQGYVEAICCTGANLEEDLFNAVAHNQYERIENYRDLTPTEEENLLNRGMNRVTDTCIPETEAMRKVEKYITPLWHKYSAEGRSQLPHSFLYEVLRDPDFIAEFQIDPKDSWMLAASERDLPIFVPGWEDSTLGNFFVSQCISSGLEIGTVQSGLTYMHTLVSWYKDSAANGPIGFFQIGGGIAGDFPICVVPLIRQDLGEDVSLWGYFCQITDAQESYGGYSGALPNEKITWGKLDKENPKFVIHSDASIVVPLIFHYVLESHGG